MGTIVGAIAGQEEATCRVIDSLIRLQAGEYQTSGAEGDALRKVRRGDGAGPQRLERRRTPARVDASFTGISLKRSACSRRVRSCCASAWPRERGSPAAGRFRPARSSLPRTVRRCGTPRAGRVHPRPASPALPAVRMESTHLPRTARLAGDHRRDDDCAARTSGSVAARTQSRRTGVPVRAAVRPVATR